MSAQSPGLSTSRIETLVDGVFAIAMTLLILEIKVPQLPPDSLATELPRKLFELWPNLLAYGLSFLQLGVFWVGHHNQYYYIRRADRSLLWINILFMSFIAFIPFSAALLGQYPEQQVSVVVYGTNLILSGLTLFLHWWYATRENRLTNGDLSPTVIRIVNRRILNAPLVSLVAIGVSFVSTQLSILIFVFVPLLYILPSRIDLHFSRRSEIQATPGAKREM